MFYKHAVTRFFVATLSKETRPSATQQRQSLPNHSHSMSQAAALHSPGAHTVNAPTISQHQNPAIPVPDVMYNPSVFHTGGASDRMPRPPNHLMAPSGYMPPHWPAAGQPANMRLMMPFYNPYGVFSPHAVPPQQVSCRPLFNQSVTI